MQGKRDETQENSNGILKHKYLLVEGDKWGARKLHRRDCPMHLKGASRKFVLNKGLHYLLVVLQRRNPEWEEHPVYVWSSFDRHKGRAAQDAKMHSQIRSSTRQQQLHAYCRGQILCKDCRQQCRPHMHLDLQNASNCWNLALPWTRRHKIPSGSGSGRGYVCWSLHTTLLKIC